MNSEKEYLKAVLSSDRDHLLNTLSSMLEFSIVAEHASIHISQCYQLIQDIKRSYTTIYEQTLKQKTAMCRQDLTRDLQTAQLLLHSIRCAMKNLEPSKPWLSDLDVRNRKYKELLQSFKSLVEAYMTLVLDNQRRFSLFFEEQINQISPYVNLERALQSVSPPLPVQILIQRGERTNDQMIQQTMGTVQNVHKDLHVLAATFRSLSEIRNELNILFERYRRRWPLLLKEEGHIYVIDDNLDLVEKISVGVLHEKNYRKSVIAGTLIIISILFFCVCIYMLI